MRNKQLRIAATTFMVLMAITVPTIVFIRSQAAQTANQADGESQRVLIEKNQIIGSTFPEPIATSQPPTPLDETTRTLPPSFDSAIRSFDRGRIRDTAFSAEVQVEKVWPSRDGGTTMRKVSYLIYRDSQGRTRRDQMPDQNNAAPSDRRPRNSVISDPVASSTYIVDHRTSTVRKLPLATGKDVDSQTSVVQPKVRGTAPGFVNFGAPNTQVAKPAVSREQVMQKEQLGQRELGGIIAEGTRFVRTVSLGNEKPIEITTEEWYSVELQTMVAITISDPRFGTSEYRLVNIVRGDPSKTLFEIPQGYKVKVE